MMDFMTVLSTVIAGDLFSVYTNTVGTERGLMTFKQFTDFCKDHAIFPGTCSKALLSQIFKALAL